MASETSARYCLKALASCMDASVPSRLGEGAVAMTGAVDFECNKKQLPEFVSSKPLIVNSIKDIVRSGEDHQ